MSDTLSQDATQPLDDADVVPALAANANMDQPRPPFRQNAEGPAYYQALLARARQAEIDSRSAAAENLRANTHANASTTKPN